MSDATQPLIHLEKVTKVFLTDEVETHALEAVDLDIHNGEYIAISGPSGCGKSTLLSILGLLDSPSDGRYQLNSQPLSEGLTVLAVGLGFGVAGAFLLRHLLASQLYGVRPMDPLVFVSVLVVLGGITLLACMVPARRATLVDPVSALNFE